MSKGRKRRWDQPSDCIVATAWNVPLHPKGKPMKRVVYINYFANEFTPISEVNPISLNASGGTPMGAAIKKLMKTYLIFFIEIHFLICSLTNFKYSHQKNFIIKG